MRILPVLTLAWLGLSAAAAAEDVYRWTDANGVVHYSDKPQSPADKPISLPSLQRYAPGATPTFSAGAPAPAAKPAAEAIAISSPAAEETIRDAQGRFTVSVAVTLGEGQGLIYYLDGSAQNQEPTPSTAMLYNGVERGQHSVSAALVGPNGEELARAPAVTIFMMPPSAKH
jgi:hypothetical protein